MSIVRTGRVATLVLLVVVPHAAQPRPDTQTARLPLTVQASNSGDFFTYQKIEYLLLRDRSRLTPDNSAELKIEAHSAARGWSLGASNPTSVPSESGQLVTDAIVRIRGRQHTIECLARVPASYKAASKTVEVQLGDVTRFFDSAGRAVASHCSASR